MSKLYTNIFPYEGGLRISAATPVDDRSVILGIDTIFMDAEKFATEGGLYGIAYKGMTIVVYGSEDSTTPVQLILNDVRPYKPADSFNPAYAVNAENYRNFWTVVGKGAEEDFQDYVLKTDTHLGKLDTSVSKIEKKINNTIDPSINKIEKWVHTTAIFNQKNNDSEVGGLKVTVNNTSTFDGTFTGSEYKLEVQTDGQYVNIVNNKVTGGRYTILKPENTDVNILTRFQLGYIKPGNADNTATGVGPIIDIPKDYVVEKVDIVKATVVNGVATDTPIEQTDPNYDADPRPAYIRITWNVKRDSSTANKSVTYIKISDIIGDDIKTLNSSVNRLDSSAASFDASLNKIFVDFSNHVIANDSSFKTFKQNLDSSFKTFKTNLDSSLKAINSSIAATDKKHADDVSTWVHAYKAMDTSLGINNASTNALERAIKDGNYNYNDSTYADDFSMLSKHGNLPKGTTVADLKLMTLSHIFTEILFEVATPVKIADAEASVAWAASSIYKTTVDVGCPWPSSNEFVATYTTEKWQWTASSGEKGAVVETTTKGAVSYRYKNGSSDTDNWAGNISDEGTTGNFYVTIASVAGSDATDSTGSATDNNGNYYRKASDAATAVGTKTSGTLSYTAAYKYASNCSKIYTSESAAIAGKNTSGLTFKGNDVRELGSTGNVYMTGSSITIYLQWPQMTDTQFPHLYLPSNYKVSSVYQAASASDAFSVKYTATEQSTTVPAINNTYGKSATYKDWVIQKNAGVTTVKIVIVKR